jgi:group II intron reverse transcriptase/maturase
VEKKFKYHSLIDKVYKRLNLYIAFEKVKANKGGCGVDGVSLEEFEVNLNTNLEEIHRLLYEDRYTPHAVRRVYIPKPSGDKRPLGIPAVRDRIVQQAILNRLGKIFEAKFKDCSYGFRSNRSCLQAIQKVEEYLKAGYQWVVEVDIEKFFDTVNQEKLIDLVAEEIADGRVLRLIRSFLTAGVMEEGKIENSTTGTPQGGVISPLLANIYLHPYDEAMTQYGYKVVRYADDIMIMCRTKQEAGKALRETREILEGRLGLKLSAGKTGIKHKSQSFEFLGYAFGYGYSDYKLPRRKAVEKFKDRVRQLTRRNQPKSMLQVIEGLNPVIRGWRNYFKYGMSKKIFWELDCWIENRLRAYKVKRWGLKTHLKMPHRIFEAMGLVTLNETFYPNQPKLAPCKGATV